jgi:Protein of unknown function (DUF1194)
MLKRFRGTAACSRPLMLALGVSLPSLCAAAPAPIGDQTATMSLKEVDVELVLAVDVSFSMDAGEQQVQRQGYLDAIRSKEFISAVESGMLGKVALTYVEWGGIGSHKITVPWRVIEDAKGAADFANELEAMPIIQISRTSISSAIQNSVQLIKNNAYKGMREVIDVSGDGPNNSGEPVEKARDMASAQGVVINGLPLLMDRADDGATPLKLDAYYEQCVITGPGSFVIPVRGKEEFRGAIRTKIVREIASAAMLDAMIIPASDVVKPKVDCMLGEAAIKMLLP